MFVVKRIRREIHTSTFRLDSERLRRLLAETPERDRLWLHAYPSSALALVRLMQDADLRNPLNFRGVILASENSSWEQRDFIAAHFDAPVFSFYGLSEKVALAGECYSSRQYHVNERYGHVELLSLHNEPITTFDAPGRIIATGLINMCAPLIRYDTGDVATIPRYPCNCSLPGLRLSNVWGRSQDCLTTGLGNEVSVAALNLHGAEYDGLLSLQYLQKSADEVEVRVVAPSWGAQEIEKLTNALARRLPRTKISAAIVDRLERAPNGKTPLVIHPQAT